MAQRPANGSADLKRWSTAAHQSILVGGGGPQKSAAARRGVYAPKLFLKDFRTNVLLSSTFFDDFFSHRKLQANKYTAKMASAARRQIIGGAPTNYRRRADQQKSPAAPPNCWRRGRGAGGAP